MWVVRNLKNKRKEKKKYEGVDRSSRILDFIFTMPPSLPMVSLALSDVRVVRIPQFGWGWDGGRSASRSPDQLDCRVAG